MGNTHLAEHVELVGSLAANVARVCLGHHARQAQAGHDRHVCLAHQVICYARRVLAVCTR
jgi:hypothetical protein